MTAPLYLEHLSDTDLALLATVGEIWSSAELLSRLQTEPEYLESLLSRPSVFTALFGSGRQDALLHASPFLVFAVLVHRAGRDLTQVRFVEEWVGPGRRVPMFDVAGLRDFTASSSHRLFLAELLASYTHVASGSRWIRTSTGWRRRRFSELDPLHLVEMLELLPDREHPPIYRRLGDLSLFLTGVFPDYAGSRFLPSLQRQRLERMLRRGELGGGVQPRQSEELSQDLQLLEQLGRCSYHLAWKATQPAGAGIAGVLADMAQGFSQARRVLTFLADRYLFPVRQQWFPQP